MTCGKCCSDAVVVDEVIDGVPIPRCYICGWRHMIPDAPPISEKPRTIIAYARDQRANGLCRNCDEKSIPRSFYCADHLEFHQRQCQRMREVQGERHGG